MARRVTTPEGAAYFGKPIGSIIGLAEEENLVRRTRRLGLRPPAEVTQTAARPEIIKDEDSTLEGPLGVTVGGKSFNLPEGSILKKSPTNSALMYVMLPGGAIHLLTPRGEVEIPESQIQAIRDDFEEAQKDADSSNSQEVLIDLNGEEQYYRRPDGEWEHAELGVVITPEDMKKVVEEGELKADKALAAEKKAKEKNSQTTADSI